MALSFTWGNLGLTVLLRAKNGGYDDREKVLACETILTNAKIRMWDDLERMTELFWQSARDALSIMLADAARLNDPLHRVCGIMEIPSNAENYDSVAVTTALTEDEFYNVLKNPNLAKNNVVCVVRGSYIDEEYMVSTIVIGGGKDLKEIEKWISKF